MPHFLIVSVQDLITAKPQYESIQDESNALTTSQQRCSSLTYYLHLIEQINLVTAQTNTKIATEAKKHRLLPLLGNSVDINEYLANGHTLLTLAIANKMDNEFLRILFSFSGIDLNRCHKTSRWTPACYLVHTGNLDLLEEFYNKGADIFNLDQFGPEFKISELTTPPEPESYFTIRRSIPEKNGSLFANPLAIALNTPNERYIDYLFGKLAKLLIDDITITEYLRQRMVSFINPLLAPLPDESLSEEDKLSEKHLTEFLNTGRTPTINTIQREGTENIKVNTEANQQMLKEKITNNNQATRNQIMQDSIECERQKIRQVLLFGIVHILQLSSAMTAHYFKLLINSPLVKNNLISFNDLFVDFIFYNSNLTDIYSEPAIMQLLMLGANISNKVIDQAKTQWSNSKSTSIIPGIILLESAVRSKDPIQLDNFLKIRPELMEKFLLMVIIPHCDLFDLYIPNRDKYYSILSQSKMVQNINNFDIAIKCFEYLTTHTQLDNNSIRELIIYADKIKLMKGYNEKEFQRCTREIYDQFLNSPSNSDIKPSVNVLSKFSLNFGGTHSSNQSGQRDEEPTEGLELKPLTFKSTSAHSRSGKK